LEWGRVFINQYGSVKFKFDLATISRGYTNKTRLHGLKKKIRLHKQNPSSRVKEKKLVPRVLETHHIFVADY
jgi:hypothetical protein